MKTIKELIKGKVPAKNYIIVAIVSLLIIILTLYIRLFYLNYRENIRNTSVFQDKTIKQVSVDDIDFVLKEMSDAILYVSYTGNDEIYNNEKKLLKEIKRKNLVDKIVYWNVTDLLDNDEYIQILKEKYPSIQDQITVAPMFIYVKGAEALEAMSSELKNIDVNVFNKLVDVYNIE